MKIEFKKAYKMLPALIIYNSRYPSKRWAGHIAPIGPIVFIRDEYEDNEGVLAHELTHARQAYRSFGLLRVFFKFRKLRLKYEVEAYAEQLKYADDFNARLLEYGKDLATMYSLKISIEQAVKLLLKKYKSN